jgi:hypothetical protein
LLEGIRWGEEGRAGGGYGVVEMGLRGMISGELESMHVSHLLGS